MGFLASGVKSAKSGGMPSLAMIHRLECKVCPLDKIAGNQHPHMKPSGSDSPLIYILGEAPGKQEDQDGTQFIGPSGRMLRARIPADLAKHIRWNNTVRTRPPANRNPEKIEIEACRPSVAADIERTKPRAIFGFGNVPLVWALGQGGITKWRGRRAPVRIGKHECWYYAFNHPSALLHMRNDYQKDKSVTEIANEIERAFHFDLKRAFADIDALEQPRVLTPSDAESNLELIECSAAGLARLEECLKWAMELEDCGVDYETFRTKPYAKDAQILTAAVGTEEFSFAFAFDHPGAKWSKAQRQRVHELWRAFLLSRTMKCVHTLRFEAEWSAVMFGADVLSEDVWEDSLNQALVLDERMRENKPDCSSLEFLVQLHFGFNLKELSPLDKKDLRQEPLADVLRYNAMDAKFHHMLWLAQRKLLEAKVLQDVYLADLERIVPLTFTQIKGVPVKQTVVKELTGKYEARIEEAERDIAALPEAKQFKAMFGYTFNPSSNKDMGEMLLKIMKRKEGIQKDKFTGKTKYVTDESILKQIDHPLVELELRRRKAQKRLSTYILPYATGSEFLWPDGMLHPTYNQPGTISDRTSAEDPNVQNMTKRDPEGKEVRRQIRAPEGFVVVSVDHGQIQGRGIAMMSRDKRYVQSLWDRHDIHEDWTNEIAYAYPARVGGKEFLKDWGKGGAMKLFRTDVKNQWTFPSFFGAHIESRAEYLGIPVSVLKPLDRKFWEVEHVGVAQWHKRLLKEYHSTGEVRHMDGRINRAPLSNNQLFNYPIQGVEAQIVMDGMKKITRRTIATGDLNFQPILEIHDDLTFLLPIDDANYYVKRIVDDMLSADFDFINVPLSIEVSVGYDLYDMDEVLVAFSDTWTGEIVYDHKFKCGHKHESDFILRPKACPVCGGKK